MVRFPKFEVGRIINLGGGKPENQEDHKIENKEPIGFVHPEKNPEPHKLPRIGFEASPSNKEKENDN